MNLWENCRKIPKGSTRDDIEAELESLADFVGDSTVVKDTNITLLDEYFTSNNFSLSQVMEKIDMVTVWFPFFFRIRNIKKEKQINISLRIAMTLFRNIVSMIKTSTVMQMIVLDGGKSLPFTALAVHSTILHLIYKMLSLSIKLANLAAFISYLQARISQTLE